MAKIDTFMEKFWLVVFVASLIVATYISLKDGFFVGRSYYIVSVIPLFGYLGRRFVRRKILEREQQQKNK